MRPLCTAAVFLTLASVAVWPSVAAEATLTPRNSTVAPLVLRDQIDIDGVGCGVPASAAFTLPEGAFDVRVDRPSVGTRVLDARFTASSVQGNAVILTAVAEADSICDPNVGTEPPANRSWHARFDVEVVYKLRVGVLFRDDDGRGKRFKVRPREVRIGIFAAARGMRWKQFGGRKAVGFGTFRSLVPCAGGCDDNGTRLRVELTRPGYCPYTTLPGRKEAAVFYTKVAFILEQRLGILKPGRQWIAAFRRRCPFNARLVLIP